MRLVITATLTIALLTVTAVTSDAIAQPQGWISGLVRNAPMSIDVKIHSANIIFQNATWYLNATDHNYHVKGFVENTVPRAALILVMLSFNDNATGTRLATGGSFSYEPPGGVAANVTIPFDINTGYNASDAHEFQHIDGDME
jgi:hypothetical protein